MPVDSQAFVSEWKGKPIDGESPDDPQLCGPEFLTPLRITGIVEQVRDGTTLRIRLLMPDGDHQMVNIALAGVKGGRVASKPGETSEQYAEEVCLYVCTTDKRASTQTS